MKTPKTDDIEKQPRGRPAYYRPKERPSRSVMLTMLGQKILDAAAARTGKTTSDIVEHLLRTHGGDLKKTDFPEK